MWNHILKIIWLNNLAGEENFKWVSLAVYLEGEDQVAELEDSLQVQLDADLMNSCKQPKAEPFMFYSTHNNVLW